MSARVPISAWCVHACLAINCVAGPFRRGANAVDKDDRGSDEGLTDKADDIARHSVHFLGIEDGAGVCGGVATDGDIDLGGLRDGGCKLRVGNASETRPISALAHSLVGYQLREGTYSGGEEAGSEHRGLAGDDGEGARGERGRDGGRGRQSGGQKMGRVGL